MAAMPGAAQLLGADGAPRSVSRRGHTIGGTLAGGVRWRRLGEPGAGAPGGWSPAPGALQPASSGVARHNCCALARQANNLTYWLVRSYLPSPWLSRPDQGDDGH